MEKSLAQKREPKTNTLRPRSAYLKSGLFDFFFQLKQCFISQRFIQDSVFHPLSAKFQQTERGLNVCG